MQNNNKVRYLSESVDVVVNSLNELKKYVISGDITDIMVVGVTKSSNVVNMSALGDNALCLLGAIDIATENVKIMIMAGMEMSLVNEENMKEEEEECNKDVTHESAKPLKMASVEEEDGEE